MASAAVEKVIFIAFGLSIFTIAGIPIMTSMNMIARQGQISHDFASFVNELESGIRIVENNNTLIYQKDIKIPDNTTIAISNDSYRLIINSQDNGLNIYHTIYSRSFGFRLDHSNATGILRMTIRMSENRLHVVLTNR